MEKEELIEIKCIGCGRPYRVPPNTILYLCADCWKKLSQGIKFENLKNE